MTAHRDPQLKQKLSLLKSEQRKIQYCYVWRSFVVSIFAGGMIAFAMSPRWQIKQQSQIIFKGDRLVKAAKLYPTIKISYPQSIVTIPSQQIERQLKSIPALESVRVNKTIFPPLVNIYIQERIPVATAVSSGKVGFLDRQGVWLDPSLYDPDNSKLPLTTIKVINFQPQYNTVWSEIFDLIAVYPTIDIKEVYWDRVGNLFLVTSNFKVLFGRDRSLLKHQFAILATFPDSALNKNLQNVAQIDLTNPDVPFLEQHSEK